MLSDIHEYILKANDLEVIDDDKLLIVTQEQNILLKKISLEFISECYEIFSKKFNNNNQKERNHLKVVWSDEEIEFLKNSYLKKEFEEISLEINKSKYQINQMLSKLKLIIKREWSDEELEFLKNNIESSTVWIAGELKRSVASVKSKKRVLKLLNMQRGKN